MTGRLIDTDFSATEAAMIEDAETAWSNARNDEDGQMERHTTLLNSLFMSGICWGKDDESQAEYYFHRCQSNSIQVQGPQD
ncbi:hypothetical protein OKW76_05315 [Sphingomonas sp. S1-29]|uniref:hypothetical protein n=1 Tax=Sphingomonas sp. S1-29 TaxID=2991074 RepID=UPI00223EAE3E|nr:hypothetical protein [Sphingomonas sp. S1-29]UZK70463.1 hypothetical protein OKW76_05315 [Sphingomonas sp. S1-29]